MKTDPKTASHDHLKPQKHPHDVLPEQDDLQDNSTDTDLTTGAEGGGPSIGYGKSVAERSDEQH